MSVDDVENLRELVEAHKKRLGLLDLQAAKYGIDCPPHILIEINEIRAKLEDLDSQLNSGIVHSERRGALRQVKQGLDGIEQSLSNIVVKEERVYRFLGIPIWSVSVVVSRVVIVLMLIIGTLGLLRIWGSLKALPVPDATSIAIGQTPLEPTRRPNQTSPAPTDPLIYPTMAMAETAEAASPSISVLRVVVQTWPDTLDPQKASSSDEIEILRLNYEGLTRLDKDLNVVPAAADHWEYNADATVLTFHLRDHLTYSDGGSLTAQNFVAAVHRTLDPRVGTEYRSALKMIRGAAALLNTAIPTDEAQLPSLFAALGVTALDQQTIQFKFSEPAPYFHAVATLWVLFPARQTVVEAGGEPWWMNPANQIGNGPFQIREIGLSHQIVYVPNLRYWAGRPKLDGIVIAFIDDSAIALQAYKNGEIDILRPGVDDLPTIRGDPRLRKEYKEFSGACTESYELNNTKAPFNNKKVRQAFATGFDRASYIRDVLKETEIKTLTWIPPGHSGYDKDEKRWDYNPIQAKQLLADAGFPNGQSLPEVKLSYDSDNPANEARAEYIIQMYQKSLGITLVPDPTEGKTLNLLRKDMNTAPQLVSGGWCADYPDPQNWLSIFWHSRSEFAQSIGYKNPEVDKLLDQADVELDPQKREDVYQQAQRLIIGDVPVVVHSNRKNYYLIKPYVKGLETTPEDIEIPGATTSLLNVIFEW